MPATTRANSQLPTLPAELTSAPTNTHPPGAKIAKSLLEDKLCACVNIIPQVESYYWWEGKIESDSELLMMIKSRADLLASVTDRVKQVHEYDVPEVIGVPILGGNAKYLEWIKESTKPPTE